MTLLEKIKKRKLKVAIIGLGYVGLELAISSSKSGLQVFGFDNNKNKIANIKKRKSTISTIQNNKLKFIDINNFYNTSSINLVNKCDIIVICVPTPLKKNNTPDMSHIIETVNSIFKFLRKDQMVILESTVYPGATEEIIVKKIKQNKNLNIGKNFYIGFSPERISPGKDYSINYSNITKVVSGHTNACLKHVGLFYKIIFTNIYKIENIKAAEFTKLYENIYRSVNIGLVNQLKIIADSMNLNIFKIIDAAKTKPYGFRPFMPGPGVGGHCIPIDPLFLAWKSDKLKVNSDFIKISRKINLGVTNWVVSKIKKKIKKKNKKILIIGLTYKKDIDDIRESPVIKIFKKLKKNYKVDFYDIYKKEVKIGNNKIISNKNLKNISKYDAVIIGTDHSGLNYKYIVKKAKKIFDTRGVLANFKSKKIIYC